MIEQILGDADDNFANDSNASDDLGVCVWMGKHCDGGLGRGWVGVGGSHALPCPLDTSPV